MAETAMTIADPNAYPNRILLMVTGRTPQVVTETLYALCVDRQPPFVPTEVHLITTAEGAQDARLSLLAPGKEWFHRFCRDYGLEGIGFDADRIHVIRDADGGPVDDIRTAGEHEACADLITETVRRFTADTDSAVHVSLAGGRKTMTYYLGNALTLFGRPQDRLSHVLVPPPYESNRDFFYPPPVSGAFYNESLKRYFDPRDAQVTLAEIPFVRLRDNLPGRFKTLESGRARFTEVVAAMQRALQPPRVQVDYAAGGLHLHDGSFVPMDATELSFYGWLARRRRDGLPGVTIPPKKRGDWTPGQQQLYRACLDELEREWELVSLPANAGVGIRAEGTLTYAFFHQRKTHIRERLEAVVGPLAAAYEVKALESGRGAPYGLAVDPARIEILGEGSL